MLWSPSEALLGAAGFLLHSADSAALLNPSSYCCIPQPPLRPDLLTSLQDNEKQKRSSDVGAQHLLELLTGMEDSRGLHPSLPNRTEMGRLVVKHSETNKSRSERRVPVIRHCCLFGLKHKVSFK